MKTKIALTMIGIDLMWHILQYFGYYPFTFSNGTIYNGFWITYWGIVFVLVCLNDKEKNIK